MGKEDLNYDDIFDQSYNEVMKGPGPKKGKGKGKAPVDTDARFAEMLGKHGSSIYRGKDTGFGESVYDNDLIWSSEIDPEDVKGSINEHRANRQGWGTQVAEIVPRTAVKAMSEILKMPGYIGGALGAIGQTQEEGWDTFVNNKWINAISQIEDTVKDEYLPVYTKKAVREGNLLDALGSTSFWAEEGADGAGFIVSMFAPGAVLKSAGLGAKIMGATAKGAELLSGEAKMAGAARALAKLGIKSAESFDVTATALANTIAESAAEAGGAGQNFDKNKDAFIRERLKEGLTPEQAEFSFKQQKGNLERNIFMSNLPLLIVPNLIQSSMIWGKAGVKALNAVEPSLLGKIGNRAKNVLGAIGSEAVVEEAGQSTVENMFTAKAKRGELKGSLDDFNIGELASNYIDTVSSTDGQKAMFLGAFFGGGMGAYHGAKEDIAGRKNSGELIKLAEEGVAHYNSIVDRDVYKRDENGNIQYNYNNKPILDETKVVQMARDLDHIEADSEEFEAAVRAGDDNKVKELKDKAVNNLIAPFITRGETGLQALKEHLDATSKATDIQESEEPSKIREFTNDIMEKAKTLQNRYETYKGFSKSLINLKNKDATKADYVEYYNQLADFYVIKEGEREDAKKELDKLNKDKKTLESYIEEPKVILDERSIDEDGNYIDPIFRKKRAETDPRIKSINEQVAAQEEKLKKVDKAINEDLWNKKTVNESFSKYVEIKRGIEKRIAEEQKLQAEFDKIEAATSVKELDAIETDNEGLILAKNKKKALLKVEEENRKAGIKKGSTKQQNKQNKNAVEQYEDMAEVFEEGDSVYLDDNNKFLGLDKSKVEGKDFTVKTIDKENGNIVITDGTDEHIVSFEALSKIIGNNPEANFGTEGGFNPTKVQTNETVTSVKDAIHTSVDSKLITVDPGTNKPYDFIDEATVEFERVPVDKKGSQVTFDLNIRTGLPEDQTKAQEMVKNKDFSNIEFLANHLPIDSVFSNGSKASIETYWPAVKDKFERTSLPMRRAIVMELSKGTPISSITTTIAGQNNGELQIALNEDGSVPENSLLGLYEVSDNISKITMENIYMVDDLGNLVNGKGQKWAASRRLAKGELYMRINTANGTPFPLKLNVKKINEIQAEALYSLYKYRFEDIKDRSKSTLLTNLPEEDQNVIKANLSQELALFDTNGQKYDSLTLKDVIDFLIWDGSKNPKSQIRFYDSNLLVGNTEYTQEQFGTPEAKADFINRLSSDNARIAKRHHVRFKDKKGGVKALTIDNPNRLYLEYIINNGIVNTNAVVGEPSFQENTSIYLTPDNVRVNGALSEFNPEVKRDKFKDVIGSLDAITKKLPGLFKARFQLVGKNYKDRYGNLYDRVSSLKSVKDSSDNLGMRNSAKRGDIIDSAFRDFFLDTKFHNLDEFVQMFKENIKRVNKERKEKTPVEFSDEVIIKLFQTFNSYAELFQENDWKVYASGFTVGAQLGNLGNNDGRYAGTTDFIVEDSKSGQRYIIDIKTSSIDRSGLEGYGGENEDTYGMVEDDKIQLNTYAHLMDKMDQNSNIVGLYILPITLRADDKSYNRSYTDAESLEEFNPENPLLEVDFEKGNLHEVLGLEEKDLIAKKKPIPKKGGKLNVKGVQKKGTDAAAALLKKGDASDIIAPGTEAIDLGSLVSVLNALGVKVVNKGTEVKKTTATTNKAPVIKPKPQASQKVTQFNTGEAYVAKNIDLTAVTYNEQTDKVTVDGQEYYVNIMAPQKRVFVIAKKVNGTISFDVDLSKETLNKIGIEASKKNPEPFQQKKIKESFDNIWKSRLESVSLQEQAEEESPVRKVEKPKVNDSTEKRVETINNNRENRPSDGIDFDNLSAAKAKEVFMSLLNLIKGNETLSNNSNLKNSLGKINKAVRENGDFKAGVSSLVKLLETNGISREEMQKKC